MDTSSDFQWTEEHEKSNKSMCDAEEERPISGELEVGLLRLSRENYEVFYGEDLLLLTPKEFSMLELLMSKAGKLVTYELMLQTFYPYQKRLEPCDIKDIMRQRVHHIRQKLLCHSDHQWIQSVWGVGYKLSNYIG